MKGNACNFFHMLDSP